MRCVICSPDWPDWMRRTQASRPSRNGPNAAGIVRVDFWPIWWQPMQSTLFIWRSQFSRVMLAGILPEPPNSLAGGIFSIANQYAAGEYCAAAASFGACTGEGVG